MTWKGGFLLFYFSRYYKRQYYNVYTILPKDEDVNSYGGQSWKKQNSDLCTSTLDLSICHDTPVSLSWL